MSILFEQLNVHACGSEHNLPKCGTLGMLSNSELKKTDRVSVTLSCPPFFQPYHSPKMGCRNQNSSSPNQTMNPGKVNSLPTLITPEDPHVTGVLPTGGRGFIQNDGKDSEQTGLACNSHLLL